MLKGFKDFILRGNVIELSIAVVVGTAFTALVSAFTSNIVNPILAAAGGVQTQGLGFHIWPGNDKTFVNIGAVVTAFLTFLITAAVVYFIFVAPMNRINRMVKSRLSAAEPEEEPIPADTALLAEIRDLLANLAGPEAGANRARVGEHPDGEHPEGEYPSGKALPSEPAGVASRTHA
ncbi:large conductance mechanosensitive channel protein MscL [Arthrobacter sp. 131MFCol6.1]|uniref:large conductance mechanosensitive channel protein MscL n=1 Tax=Arthrobacter sp. 131MFCol6.1 TaxID=1157944 RepID=UPI00036099BA|nr:large conductance mechanosensitive channel protein MscL [Arthrobacter sp. 131MFCol6.1]